VIDLKGYALVFKVNIDKFHLIPSGTSYRSGSFPDQYLSTLRSRLFALAVLSVSFYLTACSSQPEPTPQFHGQQRVDFSGSWELDGQMSDRVMEKIRWLYAAARSDAERRARSNSNRRGPAPVNASDGYMREIAALVNLGRLAEMVTKATVLTITQTDSQIIIERDDDFALVCEFGMTRKSETELGQELCGWFGEQLAFEIDLPEGLRVSHLLTLAAKGDRLNLATTVYSKHARQPFSLNRVYVPFEPLEDHQYDCEYTLVNQTTCTRGELDR
jgi:hypothetical protein